MKNSTLVIAILLALFWACGNGSEKGTETDSNDEKAKTAQIEMMKKMGASDAEIEEMKKSYEKLQEIADNMEEMEAEGEEDKAIYSDKNIKLLGLTTKERKITDEEWENANVLRTAWKKLTNEQLRELTAPKIEDIILSTNYTNFEEAKLSLNKIAEATNFLTSVSMKIAMLQSTKLIDGNEEYEKEMKKLGDKINERGFGADDLKKMDENVIISGTITEIMYRLNNSN